MKKIIATLLLLIIILLSFAFVYLKIASNRNENNYFNTNLRDTFARYPILRKIIGLHYDGDAKSDYLGPRYKEIVIKVVTMKGLSINNEIMDTLSKKIESITGKKTDYQYLDSFFPFSQISSLNNLKKEFRQKSYPDSKGKATLFIIIANENDISEQIGSTLGENTIVLFSGSLLKATGNDVLKENIRLSNKYSVSTLLHEFGHQLGLDHNNFTDCLMYKDAEFNASPSESEIIDNFCEFEQNQISSLISKEAHLK